MFTFDSDTSEMKLDEKGNLVHVGEAKPSTYEEICYKSGTLKNEYNWKVNSVDHDVSYLLGSTISYQLLTIFLSVY